MQTNGNLDTKYLLCIVPEGAKIHDVLEYIVDDLLDLETGLSIVVPGQEEWKIVASLYSVLGKFTHLLTLLLINFTLMIIPTYK